MTLSLKPLLLISLALILLLLIAGCISSPTGCVPILVSDKQVKETNVHSLVITIEGQEYHYYNPSLLTYSSIKINETNYVKFIPMAGNPGVKLCSDKEGWE